MRGLLTIFAFLLGTSAVAEVVDCNLSGVSIRFAIDHDQFAPPVDASDPPRRQVTTVAVGGATYIATPLVMGDWRGFEVADDDGAQMLMVMKGDGTAVLKNAVTGEKLSGTCEVSQ